MSALTKTLIVLLTVATIFLCGTVVTWVANADNYKEQAQDIRQERDRFRSLKNEAQEQLNQKIAEMDAQKRKLDEQIASLKTEFENVRRELSIVEDEKQALSQKVQNWASVVENFQKTNETQQQLLSEKIGELTNVQEELAKERKQLNETSSTLMEKLAVINTLQNEKKRLIEEKEDLKNRLDKYLNPVGRTAVAKAPVTRQDDYAQVSEPVQTGGYNDEIGLNGRITDLKDQMASISLGKADGVKQGMKFYVTRGDEFICELTVVEVDSDESVAVTELIVKQPRVGDIITTNL